MLYSIKLKMNKKATSFTIYTLIGAIAAIILIFVLLFVFSGKTGLFSKSTECTAQGGYCADYCEYMTLGLKGCNDDEVCCLKPS
jgi:hypothetical protein